MAKQNANQINKTQAAIPEKHRDRMRLSDDGKTIFATVAMTRYVDILIRKTQTIKVDRATFTPEQISVTYDYGEGRRCRDGAPVEDAKGRKLKKENPKDAALLLEYGVAHCETRIEIMQGKRAARATSSGVTSITRECRRLFVQFAIKNLSNESGERFTAKTLPSELVAGKSAEACEIAAKRIGIPPKKLTALIKRGTAIAGLIDDDTDMSI